MSQTIQVSSRGVVTIPVDFRRKYHLARGSALTIVDVGSGFFISPKQSELPDLVGRIENLRGEHNISLEDLKVGVEYERHSQ